MKRRIIAILLSIGFLVGTASPVHAAEDEKRIGLQVAPTRYSLVAKAGETKNLKMTVTNKALREMSVSLNVEQFSVDSTSHRVSFSPVKYDWITAKDHTVDLKPNQSTQAEFTITIPQNAAAGEYYFALLASRQASAKTVRAASLAYVFVDGGKIDRSTAIEGTPPVTFGVGGSIPYSFEIKNSGNIHLETQATGTLTGSYWETNGPTVPEVILPNQSRRIAGNVIAPFFPGIYTLNYIVTNDATKAKTTESTYLIYLPPWSIAAIVLLLLAIVWLWQRHKPSGAADSSVRHSD